MKYKIQLAALLLSAAIISAPGLSAVANAHDDADHSTHHMRCEHEPLSKDKIELLRATFKKVHEDNKAVFEEMHKLFKEKHEILAAKTFNKESFLTVSEKIEKSREQLAKSHAQAFASIADKFTPEERERLGRMWGHHRHHHHHGRHDGWKYDEGHEGWHHHDGQMDGISEKNQTPAEPAQEETTPVPAQ